MALFILSVVGSDRPGLTQALAAAVLSALPGWFQFIGDYKLLVYGALLFAMMRFSPHGLAGLAGHWIARAKGDRA